MKIKDFLKGKKKPTTPVVEEPKNPYYKGFIDGKHVFEVEFNSYVDTASEEHSKDEDGNYIDGRWDTVYVPVIEARSNHSLIPDNRPKDTVTFTVDPKAIANYPNGEIYNCTRCSVGMAVTNSIPEVIDRASGKRCWNSSGKTIHMQVGIDLNRMVDDSNYANFVIKTFSSSLLNGLGIGIIDGDFPRHGTTYEKDEKGNLKHPEAAETYKKAMKDAYAGVYNVGGVSEKDGKLIVISPEELDRMKNRGVNPTTPGSNGMATGLKR